MPPIRLPSVILYALLPIAFAGVNWFWPADRSAAAVRWPVLQRTKSASAPVASLDLPLLKQSINRLPAAGLMRQTGNSLRIAGGQELSWCMWNHSSPPALYHSVELWVSEGLTDTNRPVVDGGIATIVKYHEVLQREGWTLIVVPVPTKLSIHRDRSHWPNPGKDLLSRHAVDRDRGDEIYDRIVAQLQSNHIPVVDLRTVYREHLRAHPDTWLYPAGETHWSGLGLELAANATAELVSSASGVPRRKITPAYLDVEEVADMAAAFNPLPQWPSRLEPVYKYRDRLLNGDATAGFQYAQNPTSLMVIAGTSYSGQFTWHIGQPVGFAWAIGGQLEECEFHNGAQAGHGSFAAFAQFLAERQAKAADFARRRQLPHFPKIVVWEFPVRDLPTLLNR